MSGATTFNGTVDGQLDNPSNWASWSAGMNMDFKSSFGFPLYLSGDLTETALRHEVDAAKAITNEFALGAGHTLTLTGGNNAVLLRGHYSQLKLTSGTIKLGETDNSSIRIGDGNANYYTMLVTGEDAAVDTGSKGTFHVGWGAHSGCVSFRDGATFAGKLSIGQLSAASSNNTVLVSDPGTSMTLADTLSIGANSFGGLLAVSNGATLVGTSFKIPGNYGGTKGFGNVFRVEVDAAASFSGTLDLGVSSYSNRVEVLRGGTLAVGTLNLAANQGPDGNFLTVADGGVYRVGTSLVIGSASGSTAVPRMSVTGGEVYCLASGSSDAVYVGKSSPGRLDITDGGLFVVSNNYLRIQSAGSLCRVGPGGRLETRTNGRKDVRFSVSGGSDGAGSLVVDGGTVEAATHCLYLMSKGDVTVKNGGSAKFMKFYSDEVYTLKHSTVHVDDGTLAFSQWMFVGYRDETTKGTVSVSGRRARLTAGSGIQLKGDSTLDFTVPAEGFEQVPVSAPQFDVVSVSNVDKATIRIDASAFAGASRIVLVKTTSNDISGLGDVTWELSDNAVLDLTNPREIAVYVNTDLLYTGEGGESWNDANNWTNIVTGGKAVPAAGQGVIVAPQNATTLVLDASTPTLRALGIGGNAAVTLVLTNWTTAVRADNVRICSGSTVTCAGPFSDNEMSNRVWIVCKDLTIDSGGKIDVSSKGYAKPAKGASGNVWPGYGPGTRIRGGATHGGYGAAFAVLYADSEILQLPNDCVEEPEQPGSSGGVSTWSSSDATMLGGGGAVRIDATGAVTVNGSILASVNGAVSGTYAGACAGGSILIWAATFRGADGVLKAEGGGTSNAKPPYRTNDTAFPGGGGRIAIHYASADTSGLTVSAGEGLYNRGDYPFGSNDYNRIEADMGTLYFSDDSIWKDGFGKRITGVIANPCATDYDFGDVDFTGGRIRFGADGLTLRMDSLAISGNNVCLELGGSTVEQVTGYRERRSTEPCSLVVAGDLSIADNGRLDVRAASVGDADGVGATVTVGGSLTVGAKGYVYAWSDVLTGAHPRFVVSNEVTVAAGGVVSAERRGFAGAHNTNYDPVKQSCGHGPGAGCFYNGGTSATQYGGGGGHGGKGTVSVFVPADQAATNGLTYDDAKYPKLAGSGGSQGSSMWGASSGGGVIELLALGAMTVDGLVIADGEPVHYTRMGSGAGGSIVLMASSFCGTGTLSAKGGPVVPQETGGSDSRSPEEMYRTGAGGGGRIGVILGNCLDGMTGKTLARVTCPVGFTGRADVAGGVHPYDTYAERKANEHLLQGESGTVRFSAIGPKPGLLLIVR